MEDGNLAADLGHLELMKARHRVSSDSGCFGFYL